MNFTVSAGLQGFWQSAASSADLQTVPSLDRWDMDSAYSPKIPPTLMTIYSRFGAFIEGIEQYDCDALRVNKAEAIATDPQQRLLMEHFLESIQQASGNGTPVGSSTGIFFNTSSPVGLLQVASLPSENDPFDIAFQHRSQGVQEYKLFGGKASASCAS